MRRLRLSGSFLLLCGLLALGIPQTHGSLPVASVNAAEPQSVLPLTVIDGKSGNNNGTAPTLENGVLKTSINAGAQSGRSEVMWGDENTQRLFFENGDTVVVDFDVLPGACGPNGELPPDRTTWHVVYQLHGALLDKSWGSGPSVSLVWQRGTWFIRGGLSVKQADGKNISLASQAPETPAGPCGTWQHWRFDQKIGGPGVGSVNGWLDGKQVITNWMPKAGTMYTDSGAYSHAALQIKDGIYVGGFTPWQRTMEHRNITITRTRDGVSKTWSTGSAPASSPFPTTIPAASNPTTVTTASPTPTTPTPTTIRQTAAATSSPTTTLLTSAPTVVPSSVQSATTTPRATTTATATAGTTTTSSSQHALAKTGHNTDVLTGIGSILVGVGMLLCLMPRCWALRTIRVR